MLAKNEKMPGLVWLHAPVLQSSSSQKQRWPLLPPSVIHPWWTSHRLMSILSVQVLLQYKMHYNPPLYFGITWCYVRLKLWIYWMGNFLTFSINKLLTILTWIEILETSWPQSFSWIRKNNTRLSSSEECWDGENCQILDSLEFRENKIK